MKRRFARFVLVGGIAAAVNLAARFLISLRVEYEWAVALAYPFGLVTAFTLNRLFVFDPSGRSPSWEIGWFLLINLVALLQIWLVSVGLVRLLFPAVGYSFYPLEVAHLIGVATPIITSYFGHRYVTFRRIRE